MTAGAGCQGEPSLLCNRIRLIWPFFELDPSLDTSPAEGLQIDLTLRSSLLPGSTGQLTVQGAEDDEPVPHPDPAVADDGGNLIFSDVNVPFGRVRFQVSIDSECGEAQSSREPYVWDGLGFPACDVDLGVAPALVGELAPLAALRVEHDADPQAPGLQLRVAVNAGRPDMAVSLFLLDQASGEEQRFEEEAGDDLAASFPVTLGEGEQSVRAVCVWEPGELRPSSPTLGFWVDTGVPDCDLVEPGSRVVPADDVDPDTEGVQFSMTGRSLAEDVAGRSTIFTVQGAELDGSAVDGDGASTATATLVLDPPAEQQNFGFVAADAAGNRCEDSVTFE